MGKEKLLSVQLLAGWEKQYFNQPDKEERYSNLPQTKRNTIRIMALTAFHAACIWVSENKTGKRRLLSQSTGKLKLCPEWAKGRNKEGFLN